MPKASKRSKVFASLALAITAALSPALADHALEKPKSPTTGWAGLYGGLALGGAVPLHTGERLQAASGFGSTAFDLYPSRLTQTGVTAGAHVGYNWQIGRLVYGFETELNYLGGRHAPDGRSATALSPYALTYGPSAQFFAAIRGRVGYAFDRWLPYVTAGAASGGARGPARLIYPSPGVAPVFTTDYSQSSRMKFAVGGGLAYAFADSWSARAEYLYLDQSLNTQVFDNDSGYNFVSRVRNENHIVRFGLDYHFGSENALPENNSGDEPRGGHDHDQGHDGKTADGKERSEEEYYNVHGQTTHVVQGYPRFRARYDGPNSFPSSGQTRAGSTSNLFAGVRLWKGGAVFINPEIDQGYGLSNSVGSAAYPNGAVAKVGSGAPYMRFQRYFVRQIIGLDGSEKQRDPDEGSLNEALESAQNQLAGEVDKDRLVLTVGKFAVGDVFDDNVYAHDPTTGFLNFTFNGHLSFDYGADSWGYTHGAAAEWKQGGWTTRAGLFQLSKIPNGPEIEPVLGGQFMAIAELERRYELFGQPGAIKFMAYGDNGYISRMDEAVAYALAVGQTPTFETNRRKRLKTGGGVNIKQQLMPNLGFFLRANLSDGRYETVDYTDADRNLSFGLVAAGELWGRPKDEIGGALAFSGLSGSRVRYFANGGTSVYIGDGALTYGGEKNLEAYYKWGVAEGADLTFDYQVLVNPAHNLDRGPINVFGVRAHAQF